MSGYRVVASQPRIPEMLADPIVQAVMRRDNVTPEEILQLVGEMRERLSLRRRERSAA